MTGSNFNLTSGSQALAHWASWAPRLAGLQRPSDSESTLEWKNAQRLINSHAALPIYLPDWAATYPLRTAFEAMMQAETHRFNVLYQKSKNSFAPLSDPLDVSVQLHRQMSWHREEVYSDWFHWVLLQLENADLISRALAMRSWEHPEKPKIKRETVCQRGFEDQGGRLDLMICDGDRCMAIVEVKTRGYAAIDLEKHKGYAQSVKGDPALIFLAVDPPESILYGFRYLSWADVCINLRKIVTGRLDPGHILSSALILAFIAAVEQNLLGFDAASQRSAKKPAMVEHFKVFLGEEN